MVWRCRTARPRIVRREPTTRGTSARSRADSALPAAIIFAKTRGSWAAGINGGLAFGFLLGLFGSFAQFFSPMVIEGFPYYMGWCWFGINLIVSLALGTMLGLVIRRT